jgi:hypothetical protein
MEPVNNVIHPGSFLQSSLIRYGTIMKVNRLIILTILISIFSTTGFCAIPTILAQPNNTVKSPLYAGVTLGYGATTWGELVGDPDEAFMMAISTPTSVNENGAMGGAFVGYEIFPAFALEFAYTHYANARMYFDEYSLVTYQYDGIRTLVTHTNNYALVGKFMVPVPHTKGVKIFSSVGPSVTHRQDSIYDHWQLTPTFNLGLDFDVTQHIMVEVGANYTAGTAISEMNPVKDYIPFLYSGFARLAWRF